MHLNERGTKVIPIPKDALLAAIRQNRTNHRKVFEEALENYRLDVIAGLERMIADAKKGKRVSQHLGLIEPMDQTREYDRVIRILEMTVDDTIDLTEGEFARYVMDDWDWKAQFEASTMNYMVSNRRR